MKASLHPSEQDRAECNLTSDIVRREIAYLDKTPRRKGIFWKACAVVFISLLYAIVIIAIVVSLLHMMDRL